MQGTPKPPAPGAESTEWGALRTAPLTALMKTSSLLTLVLWLPFVSGPALAADLTGVFIFSCDSAGNPAGNLVWDTRGLDSDFYKVWLTPGEPEGNPDGLTASFINGPDWGHAPINLALPEGQHQFTMFFEDNGAWPFFAVIFFFAANT